MDTTEKLSSMLTMFVRYSALSPWSFNNIQNINLRVFRHRCFNHKGTAVPVPTIQNKQQRDTLTFILSIMLLVPSTLYTFSGCSTVYFPIHVVFPQLGSPHIITIYHTQARTPYIPVVHNHFQFLHTFANLLAKSFIDIPTCFAQLSMTCFSLLSVSF